MGYLQYGQREGEFFCNAWLDLEIREKKKGLGQAGRMERGGRVTLPGNPLWWLRAQVLG